MPREIYRIPIRLDQCNSDNAHGDSCGENCGPLAMRFALRPFAYFRFKKERFSEVRKVSSTMVTQPPSAKFETLPKSSASRKVSIYVRAKQAARLPDAFEEELVSAPNNDDL